MGGCRFPGPSFLGGAHTTRLWREPERSAGLDSRWGLRSLPVAANRVLTGLPNPLEIAGVWTAVSYRVVHAMTEAVRQDGVFHGFLAALSLGDREVLKADRHALHRF